MLHGQPAASALNRMEREHRKSSGHMDTGAGNWLFLRARSQPELSASGSTGLAGAPARSGYSSARAQAHAQMAIDCVRKVIANGQCAVVIIFPLAILWVTEDSHLPLGVPSDLESLTLALEQKVSTDDSAELAERILRSARCAELDISSNPAMQARRVLRSRNFKVDIDCYFKDPDLHCAIALLTPGAQSSEPSELHYEQAQLSSVRYHIGVMSNSLTDTEPPSNGPLAQSVPDLDPAAVAAGSRSAAAAREFQDTSADSLSHSNTQHMHDFIPSMTCREVEYFYSLLPGTASGAYMHHEHEAAHSSSIMEQEQQITDPDNLDPHQRLRLLQAVPAVLPRRPRDLAEVQAEAAAAVHRGDESRFLGGGAGFAGYHMSNHSAPATGPVYKKSGIKCLECGVDQSPEWRKGPMGPKTLCNRCGLRYAKKLRMQSK